MFFFVFVDSAVSHYYSHVKLTKLPSHHYFIRLLHYVLFDITCYDVTDSDE